MSQDKDYLFEENGVGFITAEHYMMYHKALLFGDLETADKILKTVHPRDVKRLGRLVKNYDDSVWSEKRFDVVLNGNILKFSQNPELLDDLKKYKNRIRDDEETQLAFYIHLIEAGAQSQVADARYVGVDRHVGQRLPEAPLGDAAYIHAQAAQLRERVQQLFVQMIQGQPLAAFGEKGACVYCDYRALCRRDYVVSVQDTAKQGGAR